MSIFSALKGLFGGGDSEGKASTQTLIDDLAIDYNGYRIVPAPIQTGNNYRVGAIITKDEQEHRLIRADEMPSQTDCIEISLRKAKQMIDQQGDGIFTPR